MDRKDSNSCSIQFFLLGKVITQKGLATLGQSFSLTDVCEIGCIVQEAFLMVLSLCLFMTKVNV